MAPPAEPPVAAKLNALFKTLARGFVIAFAAYSAFHIRTIAIREYGPLIHECVRRRPCGDGGGDGRRDRARGAR